MGRLIQRQKQAMIIEGYWHPGETVHEKPEVGKVNRATWVPVPESRRGKKIQQGGGHMVLFYKGAKNPAQAAWPVAEFINSKEHCDPVFKTLGWLPDFKPFLETVDPSPFPGLKFYTDSVDRRRTNGIIRSSIRSQRSLARSSRRSWSQFIATK